MSSDDTKDLLVPLALFPSNAEPIEEVSRSLICCIFWLITCNSTKNRLISSTQSRLRLRMPTATTEIAIMDGQVLGLWEHAYQRDKDRIVYHDKMHMLSDWLPKKSVLSRYKSFGIPPVFIGLPMGLISTNVRSPELDCWSHRMGLSTIGNR